MSKLGRLILDHNQSYCTTKTTKISKRKTKQYSGIVSFGTVIISFFTFLLLLYTTSSFYERVVTFLMNFDSFNKSKAHTMNMVKNETDNNRNVSTFNTDKIKTDFYNERLIKNCELSFLIYRFCLQQERLNVNINKMQNIYVKELCSLNGYKKIGKQNEK